jgi:glycosyltransferase involved in cell wall biosynthesis
MHASFVCDEYPPAPHGGTGSSYRDLAEGLVEAGHQATVFGVYSPRKFPVGKGIDEILNGVRVVRLPMSPEWLRLHLRKLLDRLRLKRALIREHRRSRFDFIETSDYGGWLPFGGPAGAPTIVRIRGSDFFFDMELGRRGHDFEHRLERVALSRADCIGAVSQYAATRTLEICGLSHCQCTVIHNAVDTEKFSPSDSIKTEPGLIVYVNSLNPKKGIEQLIDAMNLLCTSRPELKLIAIGEDTQKAMSGKSYLQVLQDRIRPEFRTQVEFLGRQDRETIVNYLRCAQICCYPSHMETFGIAAIEAMSVGKPTIFSKTGPGSEIVEDGISGLLCDPRSPEDIAAKIAALLDNPTFAEQLGQSARQRVLQQFDKRNWIPKNLEFFRSCITSRAGKK